MSGFAYIILMLGILGTCIYIKDLALKYFPYIRNYSTKTQYTAVFILFIVASRATMYAYNHGYLF